MRTLTALAALFAFAAYPQGSSNVSLSNGIQLQVTSSSDGGDSHPLKTEMRPATGNSIYRVYRDETGLAVYAYELVVDRLPDGTHFQIVAKPAGPEFAAKFPNADGGKPTPTLPQPVQSAPIGSGGRFTVEIPTNPGWFEHRVDIVQIGFGTMDGAQQKPKLRFVGLRVTINGVLVPNQGSSAAVAGRFVMFYVPRRGGYFFSAEPVESRPFVQAATVDGTRLKFTINNVNYDCLADAPILVGSERGQIWVYNDPNYRPTGNLTKSTTNPRAPPEFFTAGSDSLEWWLP